jgi:nucleoside-diphosphate-sugar epimerase
LIRMKADPTRPREQYVPSTERARTELGLQEHIGLREALRRTIDWYRSSGASVH